MNLSSRLLAAVLILVVSGASGQQTKEQFEIPVRYLLSLPDGYADDTSKRWPLVIFLHGSGESGEDLDKVKFHGPPKLVEQGKKFPFIVVSPQANANQGWQPEIMQHFLRGLKNQLRIDRDRVYLTGLSMGGFGTWNWASKYPKEFAAIVPICGGGDTSEAWKLKNIPVWCFHGGKDNVVVPEESTRMVAAVRRYNPAAKLTIYPDAGHDSWTETYNNDSVYAWMLSQKRTMFTPVNMPAEKLKEYAGAYTRTGKDTLKIEMVEGKLMAKTGGPDLQLFPTGNDGFFINEGDNQFEIKFSRNKKGALEKFVFYGDRTFVFTRLKM